MTTSQSVSPFNQKLETFIFFSLSVFILLVFPFLSKRGTTLVIFETFIALPTLIFLFSNFSNIKWIFKDKVFISILLLLSYTTLSSLWNANSDWKNPDSILKPVVYSFLFTFAVVIASNSQQLKKLDHRHFTLAIFIIAIAAFDSIFAHLLVNDINTRISPLGRLSHEVTGMYFYGTALLASLILILNTQGYYQKINATSILFISLIIFFSYTRSVWVACLVCLVLHFALSKDIKKSLMPLLLILIIPISIIAYHRDLIREVFFRDLDIRMIVWQESLIAILNAPFFGHGNDWHNYVYTAENGISYFPHNIILTNAFAGGIIAVLLYLACLFLGFKAAIQHGANNKRYYFAGLVLLLGAVALLFDGNVLFTKPHPIWFLFLFPMALLVNKPERPFV